MSATVRPAPGWARKRRRKRSRRRTKDPTLRNKAGTGDDSDRILERLKALHPKIIDLSLDRVQRLLDAMGNPEQLVAPVVHVAGTNGKGSTIAFLRAMLEAGGHRVQSYVSPHLVRFHERVHLTGGLIPEPDLAGLLAECEDANGGAPITFFEITTAAALCAFAREPADFLLLETGLGGRLDATNMVARPALTIITPISHDHHQYLGESLGEIAGEKAGILKAGVPAVVSRQPDEVLPVIEKRTKDVGAPLLREGAEWTVTEQDDGMSCAGPGWSCVLPRPRLVGRHQIANAGLAVAAARALAGAQLDDAALATGLAQTQWPARLQKLETRSFGISCPPGWEIWLDGGHNPAAGAALAEQAALWTRDGRPLFLVFGMLNSKSPENFLRPLAPYTRAARAVPVPGEPASLDVEDAAAAARAAGIAAAPAKDVRSAIANIAADTPEPARVLICGSLYLAGAVLRQYG